MHCFRITYEKIWSDGHKQLKTDELFIANSMDLREIEESQQLKTIHHHGEIYIRSRIISGEYLGPCEIVTTQPKDAE